MGRATLPHSIQEEASRALPAPAGSQPQAETKPIQHNMIDSHNPEDVEAHPPLEELKGTESPSAAGIGAQWETLCPDIQRVVLGRLSLNELGRFALRRRDIFAEFVSRLAEEQARLISLGQETFGKDMFFTIAKACQRFLASRSLDYHEVLEDQSFIIDAAGELEYVGKKVAEECRIDDQSIFIFKSRQMV